MARKHKSEKSETPRGPVASVADDAAPFGTRPRRSNAALIGWFVIYGLWFCVLAYLAAFTVGRK